MGKFFRQRPIFLVSFLSICFLGGFVFSGYLEISEIDIFSPNLCFENPDSATMSSVEKIKINLSISYFEHLLLPNCNSFLQVSLVLPVSLDNQIDCPIRC